MGISTGLRIKGRQMVLQACPQQLGQLFQHVIWRKPDPVAPVCLNTQGKRYMAVAKVVAQTRQKQSIFNIGGCDRLISSTTTNCLATTGAQQISMTQHRTTIKE